MVECVFCALMKFLHVFLISLVQYILEHPLMFACSSTIGFVVVTNAEVRSILSDLVSNYASYWRSIYDLKIKSKQICKILFDYGPEKGPHNWEIVTPINQSPINIFDDCVREYAIREPLTWNHYEDLPRAVMLENAGHTVILRAAFAGNRPTICGADLLASYTFVEIRFRWSLNNSEGSEHMINYKKFPLELQAMHRTGPDSELLSSYDIMMIAYVFEISAHNPYLDPVVENLHLIQKPGSKAEIAPFPMAYLCHQFRSGFYSYGGSLTEPPCYQGAEWFILSEPLAIAEGQLNAFRQLLGPDGKSKIIRNARPVQPLNDSRLVNLNHYNAVDSAVSILASDFCDDSEAEEVEVSKV